MLEGLSALIGGRVRLWREDAGHLRPVVGGDPGWAPPRPADAGLVATADGPAWFEPVAEAEETWLEVRGRDAAASEDAAPRVRAIASALLGAERQWTAVADELASRYAEINLLYAISEILGRTVRLEEATRTIVREVADVVGARRASIMVFDEEAGVLRTVASRGFPHDNLGPVDIADRSSIAARVYREGRAIAHEPGHPAPPLAGRGGGRGYRGRAFLSVPISYPTDGGAPRCVGVINLTDRIGGDRFTPADRKLVSAIANQIGAAVENARLVERDLRQQRLHRELELAHDLQLRLLPPPSVLHGDAEVAARCLPAESVGGDFYTFTRLGRGRVGVMIGDVASHGFSAALVMALVMSAAGIHAGAALTPDETLAALVDSLGDELVQTEMYFTAFYGVLDPLAGRLSYASAGHPHAFRVPRFGPPERLEATAPPLGLAPGGPIGRRQHPWSVGADLLCLWTDGLVDARNEAGERFGEARVLAEICARRSESAEAIVGAVLAEAEAFGAEPTDDRTLLVLRI